MVKTSLTTVATILLCATCISCIRRETVIPEIHGTVSNNNVPHSNAKVRFEVYRYTESRDKRSVVASATKLTDQDGSFNIDRTTKFGIQIPLPADWLIPIGLCVEQTPEKYACWRVELFGPPDPPPRLEISCDLSDILVCNFLDSTPVAYQVRTP